MDYYYSVLIPILHIIIMLSTPPTTRPSHQPYSHRR
jgi:hypothetical protein